MSICVSHLRWEEAIACVGKRQDWETLRVNNSHGHTPNVSFADAWDGYISNKNRTLKTLADHKIGNNIMMAGDSHLK